MSAISREEWYEGLYPIAYFLGAWLGDGSYRWNPYSRTYQICYVSMDKDIVTKVKHNLMWFNDLRKPSEWEEITKSGTRLYRLAYCNKVFTDFICKLTAYKTMFPEFIWTAPKRVRLELLSGLMDADGSIVKQKNSKCRKGYFYILRFTGTKGFVKQFPDLCRVIGIKLTGYFEENHSNPRHAQRHVYNISLPSAIDNGFKFHCGRKQARLDEAIEMRQSRYS